LTTQNDDLLVGRLAENFRSQASIRKTDAEAFRKEWVQGIEDSLASDPTRAFNLLSAVSSVVREDLTGFHSSQRFEPPSPIPAEQAKDFLEGQADKASFFRRGLAKTLGGVEWWQRNVTEPSAALAMATAFNLLPGDQEFEKKMREIAANRAAEQGLNARFGLLDLAQNATDAYRQTNTPWGLKGFIELVFDPLNLIGIGLPGIGARIAGKAGLRALIRPLQMANKLDAAPGAAINKLITLPIKGVKIPASMVKVTGGITKIPGLTALPPIKGLVAKHWTTQVRETFLQSHAAVGEAFQTAGIPFVDGSIADTKRFFAEMNATPYSGGPRSLSNIMNHVEAAYPDIDAQLVFMDKLTALKPEDAASTLAGIVQNAERTAILAGQRPARRAKVQSIIQAVIRDERHAAGIAETLESIVYRMEHVYLKKVEPILVRPWALSHLAFAGFIPMNFIEDVGMAAVGAGVNPFGVNDKMFQIISQGLIGEAVPPSQIRFAGQQMGNIWKKAMGIYENEPTGGLENILSLGTVNAFVKSGSQMTAAMQRGTWTRVFQREYSRALKEAGVDNAVIKELENLVKTELPLGMSKDVAEDVQIKALYALTTGDAKSLGALRELTTATSYLQRQQQEILSQFPDLPPDARRALRTFIDENGGINRDNMEDIVKVTKEKMLEWLRYTPEGIRSSMKPLVQAIGDIPPRSTEDALNQLRLVQHAATEINKLPQEIMAFAKHKAKTVAPNKRDGVWAEAFATSDRLVAELRLDLEDAIKKTNSPKLKALMQDIAPVSGESIQTNIDEIFESYSEISKLNQTTRQELNEARNLHFNDDTPRDTPFFDQWDSITDDIWGRNRIEVGKLTDKSRKGWNGLFENIDFHSRAPQEQRALKMGITSMLGEIDGELSQLVADMKLWEQHLPFALPGTRPTVEKKLIEIKKLVAVKGADRIKWEGELTRIDKAASAHQKPSILKEYDREINRLKKSIPLAKKLGDDVAVLEGKLAELQTERLDTVANMLPEHMKAEFDRIKRAMSSLETRRPTFVNNPATLRSIDFNLRKLNAEMKRFLKRVESGEAHKEAAAIRTGVEGERIGIAKAILRTNDGKVPSDMADMGRVWAQGVEAGAIPRGSDDFIKEMLLPEKRATLYSDIVDASEPAALSLREQKTLRDAQTIGDLEGNDTVVSLIERGLLSHPKTLKNGRLRVQLTDAGETAVREVPEDIDVQAIQELLPAYEREFQTVADAQMGNLDEIFDNMTKLSDNPPVTSDQEELLGNYFDRLSKELERRPEYMAEAGKARVIAGTKANSEFRKFFIDYDQRTNGDFIMQRFMPFWMYESRRWPRLMNLATKRPMLAKQFTVIGAEWDYGYVPLPFEGFEVNPAKGTIAGGLRRTLSRDFPELHSGYRGTVEEGLDWLGRFGFYFAPPITAAVNVLQGEIAGNLPPAFTSLLYALGAVTDLPAGMEELAFQSRYTNFIIDNVIADELGKNPQDVRQAAEQGDDDAIAELFMAKRSAARKLIAIGQLGVIRYKPQAKKEFQGNVQDAIETFVGISLEDQKDMKQLGVPLSSVIPVSGFQRKAIREAIGEDEYDRWITSSWSLRPIEEQRALRTIDDFWQAHETIQSRYEQAVILMNDAWERGQFGGPGVRNRLRDLQSQRSFAFDALKAQERFKDIPITTTERIEWTKRFNNPPPLVHPVDEVLEAYYGINPADYHDVASGETRWDEFYDARERVLTSFEAQGRGMESIVEIARKSLQRADTPLERALKIASPKIREYFGVRTQVLRAIEQVNPAAAEAYRSYRQVLNLSKKAPTEESEKRLLEQAVIISATFPEITLIDITTRQQRQFMLDNDPVMAGVYKTWISSP